jgi:hypothetical protein
MNSLLKPIFNAGVRVVLYAAIIVVAVLIVHQDAKLVVDGLKFSEQSYTEYLQEIMLLVTGVLFLVAGFRQPKVQGLTALLSGFVFTAFIREFDWLLDKIVHGFWVYPAFALLGGFVFWAFKKRATLAESIKELLSMPTWGVLLSGFLGVFVFSRLFGKGTFWKALMEDNFIRSAKNAAEEGTELFGYTLLAIAAAEYLIAKWKKK